MIKKAKKYAKAVWPFLLPFLGGAGLVLGFAPFNYALAGFLAPAVLLYCLHQQSVKQSFIRGLLFGLGLFGFGASWIYVSVYTYGGESVPVSLFITVSFVVILALFIGTFGALFNKLLPEESYLRSMFAFPTFWVLFEILRGWLFTGFPWLYLGYTQETTRLDSLAPLGSVWLVSWAVAFTAALLYEIFMHFFMGKAKHKTLIPWVGLVIAVWASAFMLKGHLWTQYEGTLDAALIQGNIPQEMRWAQSAVDRILLTYQDLTYEHADADVIVWPEAAIPVPFPYSQNYLHNLSQFAHQNQASLIVGLPIQAEDGEGFYNGLMSLGAGSGRYYKHHLVPFGEYVPFEKLLRGLIAFFDLPMSNFVQGPSLAPMISKGYRVAPALCYDVAYPFTMRTFSKDAHFFVAVSNDAWFGRSIGPWQHLQIAQFRALETGRYMLRATNTGITAIIAPNGTIQKRLPQFRLGVLRDTFEAREGETPWMTYGPWSLWAFLAVMGIIGLLPALLGQKKRRQ